MSELTRRAQAARSAAPSPLSERLRGFRVAAGLTQYGMAKELEVHPSTVFRWENGSTQPKADHMKRLHRLSQQFEIELDLFSD